MCSCTNPEGWQSLRSSSCQTAYLPREDLPRCFPASLTCSHPLGAAELLQGLGAAPSALPQPSATFLTGTAQPGTLTLPLAHPRVRRCLQEGAEDSWHRRVTLN